MIIIRPGTVLIKRSWLHSCSLWCPGSYSPPFHLIPNLITLPHWPSDYHEPGSFWHFFWCMESAAAVYTSMPISSVIFGGDCLARPFPFEAGRPDKRRIISKSDHPAGHMISILRCFKGAPLMFIENNGKVIASLLSLWQCVVKTFCCFFCYPAVAFWESAEMPSALWDCGSPVSFSTLSGDSCFQFKTEWLLVCLTDWYLLERDESNRKQKKRQQKSHPWARQRVKKEAEQKRAKGSRKKNPAHSPFPS